MRAIAPVTGIPPKKGTDDIGHTLAYQFGIGVVMLAYCTVGDGRREQRLDCAQYGDGECRREKLVDGLHIDMERLRVGYFIADVEPVADGFYAGYATDFFQEVSYGGHDDDSDQRSRDFTGYFGHDGNDENTSHTDKERHGVDGVEVSEIDRPLRETV